MPNRQAVNRPAADLASRSMSGKAWSRNSRLAAVQFLDTGRNFGTNHNLAQAPQPERSEVATGRWRTLAADLELVS